MAQSSLAFESAFLLIAEPLSTVRPASLYIYQFSTLEFLYVVRALCVCVSEYLLRFFLMFLEGRLTRFGDNSQSL